MSKEVFSLLPLVWDGGLLRYYGYYSSSNRCYFLDRVSPLNTSFIPASNLNNYLLSLLSKSFNFPSWALGEKSFYSHNLTMFCF